MKIAMLISGGVDSAVSLRLLQQQGHEITAFYLKIWLEDELAYLGECPWQEDLAYVRQICEQAKVPLEVISLQKEYHDQVVSYVIEQVKKGNTPNPDVLCNSRIKFGLFLDAIDSSFEKVATGHYAQTGIEGDKILLLTSPDEIKDQTYFLSHLSQKQLQRALFPIGQYTKAQVRQLADDMQLPNKDRKDSQGICFLGTIKFRDFIKHHLGEQTGDLIEYETNCKQGIHQGFWFYTIGQRQGLGLAGGPWYVVHKDPLQNIVYISRNYYTADKKRNQFFIEQFHWIEESWPEQQELEVKLRHGKVMYKCQLKRANKPGSAQVTLDQDDQGIASGQFAVFYSKGKCLGSGVMQEIAYEKD